MTSENMAIHMETVSAPTNIACIKYWGKASIQHNTPINSSNSWTLDQTDLRAVTTASASSSFTHDRLWLNGVEEVNASSNKRFRACVDEIQSHACDKLDSEGNVIVSTKEWQGMKVHISSYNTFPTAAGLASSAAGYAALVYALAQLFGTKELYPGWFSTIARQGSGSACRSMHGGFVAWRMGSDPGNHGRDSLAVPIVDENYWPEIRALILVVSDAKKDTSSTTGMSTSVATSELLSHRAQHVVPKRIVELEAAVLARDFSNFGRLTMMDSNQFHATCLDTYPPIFYLNDVSRSVISIVHAYNSWAGEIRAAYTFDAGPNAVLYTLEKHAVELCALALRYYPAVNDDGYFNNSEMLTQANEFTLDESLVEALDKTGRTPTSGDVKLMYYTKSGPGPTKLDPSLGLIDAKTGLNTYIKS